MDERREWQQKLEQAGIDPRGLDGKEEINEACRLLSIDGLGPKTRFRAFLKHLGEVCFNVTAEIWDCLQWKYNDSVSKWEACQVELNQL